MAPRRYLKAWRESNGRQPCNAPPSAGISGHRTRTKSGGSSSPVQRGRQRTTWWDQHRRSTPFRFSSVETRRRQPSSNGDERSLHFRSARVTTTVDMAADVTVLVVDAGPTGLQASELHRRGVGCRLYLRQPLRVQYRDLGGGDREHPDRLPHTVCQWARVACASHGQPVARRRNIASRRPARRSRRAARRAQPSRGSRSLSLALGVWAEFSLTSSIAPL